jgi:hypothetical protein
MATQRIRRRGVLMVTRSKKLNLFSKKKGLVIAPFLINYFCLLFP